MHKSFRMIPTSTGSRPRPVKIRQAPDWTYTGPGPAGDSNQSLWHCAEEEVSRCLLLDWSNHCLPKSTYEQFRDTLKQLMMMSYPIERHFSFTFGNDSNSDKYNPMI